MVRTLLVDHHDSYTYNLFQLLAEINGEEPVVVSDDTAADRWPARSDFDNVVLGPGPGHPADQCDHGPCREILRGSGVPVLGVCLGHQALAREAGARVERAGRPAHGEVASVAHDGSGILAGIPQGFGAVRYHSLLAVPPFPPYLRRTAWTEDGSVMAIARTDRPHWGVQFHPESIATEYGRRLLTNFRDLTPLRRRARPARPCRPPEPGPAAEAPAPAGLRVLTRKLPGWTAPETVFTALYADRSHAFWLDSSDTGGDSGGGGPASPDASRFSYLGAPDGPLSHELRYEVATGTLRTRGPHGAGADRGDLLNHLRLELERLRAAAPAGLPFDLLGGFVGYLGYELRADCAGTPAPVHRSPLPDAALLFVDRMFAFDHVRREVYAVALAEPGAEAVARRWLAEAEREVADAAPPPPVGPVTGGDALTLFPEEARHTPRWARDRDAYLADIARCKEWLRDGESYEICLTNRVETRTDVDPLTLYRTLRRVNPAPYAAYLRFGGLAVLSSSPERFLRVGRDGRVQAKPIKGTAARAGDPAEDAGRAEALRTSRKDRAENLMIVDLLRNDLGRVCATGSVEVPSLMAVETYRTVHHLVSTVEGVLRPGLGPVDCVRAAFPPGSMTGAPKVRTMELLDRIEPGARGVYSGAIGWFGADGACDLSVAIRTGVAHDGRLSVGTGGAVLWESDPETEYAETVLKAAPLLRAVAAAETWSPARPLPVDAPA
ncbi:aminodeoxychorismate synthase component I [Streptomyces sp. cmx-18-6]|uniref:aminodeoxychorismate synthase component I n=1 Tax=Streptomyces sp. cmx-18-6 TaxID=2790930 RepID=UPI00397EF178